jgi:hypothetical protein
MFSLLVTAPLMVIAILIAVLPILIMSIRESRLDRETGGSSTSLSHRREPGAVAAGEAQEGMAA